MGEEESKRKKNMTAGGSIRSIFMHADGVDKLLMALGFLGAMGDGFTTPLVLYISSRLMNNIGGSASSTADMFLNNINKVGSCFFPPFSFNT